MNKEAATNLSAADLAELEKQKLMEQAKSSRIPVGKGALVGGGLGLGLGALGGGIGALLARGRKSPLSNPEASEGVMRLLQKIISKLKIGPAASSMLAGGAAGAGLGSIGGVLAAVAHNASREDAIRALRSSNANREIKNRVIDRIRRADAWERWTAERRHQEMLDAMRERSKTASLSEKIAAKFSPHEMAESAAEEKSEHAEGKERGEKGCGGLKGWMAKRKRTRGGEKEEKKEEDKKPAATETNEKVGSSLLEKLAKKKEPSVGKGALLGGSLGAAAGGLYGAGSAILAHGLGDLSANALAQLITAGKAKMISTPIPNAALLKAIAMGAAPAAAVGSGIGAGIQALRRGHSKKT